MFFTLCYKYVKQKLYKLKNKIMEKVIRIKKSDIEKLFNIDIAKIMNVSTEHDSDTKNVNEIVVRYRDIKEQEVPPLSDQWGRRPSAHPHSCPSSTVTFEPGERHQASKYRFHKA